MKVRVKFSKTGVMRFIGHLDVMRYFQKALRRAGFDTALSGGFSPHMIMSFAAPLGVGLTSEGEYFDLELRSAAPSVVMEEKLNAVMADGIRVSSIRQIPDDKKAGGMRLVAAAGYRVALHEAEHLTTAAETLAAAIPSFLDCPEIPVEKQTKKGSRTLDIRPLIYRLDAHGSSFEMLVSQGSVNNLRPELVMQALAVHAGCADAADTLRIHRLDLYANTGTEAMPAFRTLESLGEIIDY